MAMASTSIHSATIPLHSTSTNTSLVCNNSCAPPPPLAKLHVGGAAAAGGGGGKGGDFFLCNNLCGHMYGNCCALVIKPRKRNRTPAVAPLAAIATSADAPTTDSGNLLQLKTELLSIVAGLDRGLLASAGDEVAADDAARKLESIGDVVELPKDLDLLQGQWRLVYSSGFVTGSLGGQRPGPPVGRLLPLTLGQVYQRIDVLSKELDNIVDLRIGTPWPLPTLELTACLAHSFELTGQSRGAGIRIIFEKTTIRPKGSLSQLPPFDTPPIPNFLRQSSPNQNSGDFVTTYLDPEFRISRGDCGELRIFVRA
ncbi:unnamed protein product [Sphagnum troendelagicum]